MTTVIVSTMWITLAALASQFLAFMTKNHIPAVVFMLGLGVIIGPEVLEFAVDDGGVSMLRELGLGLLFLLAGWEIDPKTMKGRTGRWALRTWLISITVAFVVVYFIARPENPLWAVTIAIAVSSTALGTLLPILKAVGMDTSKVGKTVFVHGAVGEMAPIFAMSLLLSARSMGLTLIILIIFMTIALVTAFIPRTVKTLVPRVGSLIHESAGNTSQTVMRSVMALLTMLMAAAAVFELDVVLGAFSAGIILRSLVPEKFHKTVEARLNVMGYGFFIPVFFITSGMAINISAVAGRWWLIFLFVGVILVARGIPVILTEMFTDTESGLKDTRDKVELGLYAATGLPIIVAVTEVAAHRDLIDEELASILVCAGAITVLAFPLAAHLVHQYWPEKDSPKEPKEHKNKRAAAEDEHREYLESKKQQEEKARQAAPAARKPQSSTVGEEEVTIDTD
ncbi:glutathione-regulated potassium-efflux system protein KefB [Corynebacterium ciconiae DSM 44920]|uniref:cation:proton antiporter n=1 Tax=Corynebacterium ciconiae TaxID=227319 RepID=UPI00037B0909|nr:cation:proton antiporter [Corynebacterium ciconiae]WKD61697.1 glutathione-regulated potassium-efflux system protein KefB [Corynebacterium ciconiae DSM 44920]